MITVVGLALGVSACGDDASDQPSVPATGANAVPEGNTNDSASSAPVSANLEPLTSQSPYNPAGEAAQDTS